MSDLFEKWLRRRRLRRLHGVDQRTGHAGLSADSQSCGWKIRVDGRRVDGTGKTDLYLGVRGSRSSAVRFLHAGNGDQRESPAGQGPGSVAGSGQGSFARQYLPLHRLCQDRESDFDGGGCPAGRNGRALSGRSEGRRTGRPGRRGGQGAGNRGICRRYESAGHAPGGSA